MIGISIRKGLRNKSFLNSLLSPKNLIDKSQFDNDNNNNNDFNIFVMDEIKTVDATMFNDKN